MALEKLEGLITFSAAQTVSVQEFSPAAGPVTVTLAATSTNYFLRSATDLLTAIANALTNDATLTGTYTASLDDTADSATGKVTISATGVTTFNITWTSTTIRDYLGFTGNLSGAATYTGGNQARFLWLPNVSRANRMAPNWASTSFDMGAEEIDFSVSVASSGASKRIGYTRRLVENFEWQLLKANKIWIGHESTTKESLQQFWRDVIAVGGQWNYHPDRSSDTVFWTWVAIEGGAFKPAAAVAHWDGASSLWNVKLAAVKSV